MGNQRLKHSPAVARRVRIYYGLMGVLAVWLAVTLVTSMHKAHEPMIYGVGTLILFVLLAADAVSVITLARFEPGKKMRDYGFVRGVIMLVLPVMGIIVVIGVLTSH